jgi:hypothetical protein
MRYFKHEFYPANVAQPSGAVAGRST